jgi:hypothetical protein
MRSGTEPTGYTFINTKSNFERLLLDANLEQYSRLFNVDGVSRILNDYAICPIYVQTILSHDIQRSDKITKNKNDFYVMIIGFIRAILSFLQFVYFILNGYDLKQPWSDIACCLAFALVPVEMFIAKLIYGWSSEEDWRRELLGILGVIQYLANTPHSPMVG